MKIRNSSNRGLILSILVTASLITLTLMKHANSQNIIKNAEQKFLVHSLVEQLHNVYENRIDNIQTYASTLNTKYLDEYNKFLKLSKIPQDVSIFEREKNNSQFRIVASGPEWDELQKQIERESALLAIEEEALRLIKLGRVPIAIKALHGEKYLQAQKNVKNIIDSFTSTMTQQLRDKEITLTSKEMQIFKNFGMLLFIIIASMIFESLSRRKNIIAPIEELTQMANSIAEGNYKQMTNNEVDNEIGILSSQFNKMARSISLDIENRKKVESELIVLRQAAEDANKSKSEFLANMSHEIRTPMNAIIGMNHLALQTDLTSKQRNYIQKSYYSAEALLGIINDILDFSKIEAGKLDIEEIDFNLEGVFENLSNLVGLKAEDKGLELMLDLPANLPIALIGDPLRLGQILVNLGNNAVKFTEQGEILISVKIIEENDSSVNLHFSVRDTGIGMTPEQQTKLFKSFSQADSSVTRQFGGTGLGLAISKRLVQLMDGEINVKSEKNRGSTFYFSMQFKKQKGKSIVQHSVPTELNEMKVLVVDDNKTSREILSSLLTRFGLHVDCVNAGNDAINKLIDANTDTPYQLVIMDWKMPGMNGIDTTRAIQSDSRLSKLPTVIMVTAYGREEAIQEAKGIDIASYLTKPVTSSSLFDAITSSIGLESSEDKTKADDTEEDDLAVAELLKGAKVLLVEDNEINQELALELLSSEGLIVTVANNGQEALDILDKEIFDGVLMDCQMPVMDGYEATRQIRKIDRFKDLPVLAMTANAMAGDREKVLEAGMNDHISKPLNVVTMFEIMSKWITPSK